MMLMNNGMMSVEAVAELMAKINKRCGEEAVRLAVMPIADRTLVVTRQDDQDLKNLELILTRLFPELSFDQLKKLRELEGASHGRN